MTILLDDGVFYLELNENEDSAQAAGFLHRRCIPGMTTPGGYECLGSFQKQAGAWSADVNAPLDEDTGSDCMVVASGVSRLDAIAALWQSRSSALSTHP